MTRRLRETDGSLGYGAAVAGSRWVPLRLAWERALYGPAGFYRTQRPADHFRTSAHASPLFARAIIALVRREGLGGVWDVGAGSGELLVELRRAAPDLDLCGVDVARRPSSLPDEVGWLSELPELPDDHDGLVLANELLDTIPCDVVELDRSGTVRLVEVDLDTGEQRLGPPADAGHEAWLDRWWPLSSPGQRAEVGSTRESWWAAVCARSGGGLCVAVDYGHLTGSRPPGGSLSSYRSGMQTPLSFDGSHDVTAAVAFDALASAVGGDLRRQRDMLHELGVDGGRPPLSLASIEPRRYVAELARATEAAELTAVGGLGDFCWLLAPAAG